MAEAETERLVGAAQAMVDLVGDETAGLGLDIANYVADASKGVASDPAGTFQLAHLAATDSYRTDRADTLSLCRHC